MKIAIGSDHGGVSLKEELKAFISTLGHEVTDCGCHSRESVDYPLFARQVCDLVRTNAVERGILICGTGIGMSMAANKFPDIRAALCHEPFSAKMSRLHNDANILCLGERVIGSEIAKDIVAVWLSTPFEGGRHKRRIELFNTLGSIK